MAKHFSFPTDEYVLIGKITKAHGIKGEVKIFSFSDQPKNIEQYRQLTLVSPAGELSQPYPVVRIRTGGKEAIAALEGITDRNGAEELCGYGILVLKDSLPKLDGDEFYLHELEGLRVVTEDGRAVGTVHSFFDNSAQDMLVVLDKGKEFLIPLIPSMIVKRDATEITIAPPPGLLDINSGDKDRE